ncbi:hypothetical protein BC831DRAFT_504696 [Entophlyctis helioformis]|nr:hypothetical protein BC831DRAFT_504696 [Entophlyctis helioformis]
MTADGAFDKALLVVCICGVVLNLLLIASIAGSQRLRSLPETILNASLAWNDLVFALTVAAKHAMILALGRENTFLSSSFGCNVDAGVIKGLAITSIATLTSIAIYHFLLIVPDTKRPPSMRSMYIWAASLWVFGGTWSCLPILAGSGYVIQPSKLFCSIDYRSAEVSVLVETTLDVILFAGCLIVIAVCYGLILLKFVRISNRIDAAFQRISRQLETAGLALSRDCIVSPVARPLMANAADAADHHRLPITMTSQPPSLVLVQLPPSAQTVMPHATNTETAASGVRTAGVWPAQSRHNRKASNSALLRMKVAIIRRTIAITAAFSVCWIPFLICTLYQTFTHSFVSATTDSLVMLMAGSAVVVNPITFFIVDVRYKASLADMVRSTCRGRLAGQSLSSLDPSRSSRQSLSVADQYSSDTDGDDYSAFAADMALGASHVQ